MFSTTTASIRFSRANLALIVIGDAKAYSHVVRQARQYFQNADIMSFDTPEEALLFSASNCLRIYLMTQPQLEEGGFNLDG